MCQECDAKDMEEFVRWNQDILDADIAAHEESDDG
jgi:hypothetical protein